MKRTTWCRITAIVLSFVLLLLGCGIDASAYNLPKGYTMSSSYKSGKYYSQLAAVQLTGNQRTDIAAIAVSQIGYHEGAKGVFSGNSSSTANYTEYNRYAYYLDNAAWCGSFVSWCAAMAGIPTDILPKTAGAKPVYWKMIGSGKLDGATAKTPEDLVTNGGSYLPQVGDLVFFGPKSTGDPSKNSCNHVGLIVEVNLTYSGKTVTQIELITAEGNYSNKVSQNKYIFNSEKRDGHAYSSTYLNTFGVPNYAEEETPEYASLDIGAYGGSYLRTTTPVCDEVRKLQQGLNLVSVLDKNISLPILTVDGKFDNNTLTAVKSFQKAEALTVDGVVGSDTWNALRSDVIKLTKAHESDYIVSEHRLYAYKGDSLASVLPEDVTVIAEDAFRYRSGITAIALPVGLQTVSDGAFSACTALKTISYAGTEEGYASIKIMGSNAVFEKAVVSYALVNITFVLDGAETTVTVPSGSIPKIPSQMILEKQGTALYEYVFLGWRMNGVLYEGLPQVDSDCTFVAEFSAQKRILNVDVLNGLLIALSDVPSNIALYDFVEDGILNVEDLNALLILLAGSNE